MIYALINETSNTIAEGPSPLLKGPSVQTKQSFEYSISLPPRDTLLPFDRILFIPRDAQSGLPRSRAL